MKTARLSGLAAPAKAAATFNGQAWARRGASLTYPEARVQALVDHLHPTGQLVLLTVSRDDGPVVAAGVFPGGGGVASFDPDRGSGVGRFGVGRFGAGRFGAGRLPSVLAGADPALVGLGGVVLAGGPPAMATVAPPVAVLGPPPRRPRGRRLTPEGYRSSLRSPRSRFAIRRLTFPFPIQPDARPP